MADGLRLRRDYEISGLRLRILFTACSGNLALAAQRSLHPTDLAMILKTATREGLDAAPEVNPKQGWPGLKG